MKIILHFVLVLILTWFNSIAVIMADNDYPRTVSERKADEMGSILGGEGLIFRPGKIRNESTKNVNNGQVNKYLWDASIEILDFAPLNSSDSAGGVIITDWYSPEGHPNRSYKLNIFVKGSVISPESIEVRVFERIFRKGEWLMVNKSSNLGIEIENQIIKRAREIHINTSQK